MLRPVTEAWEQRAQETQHVETARCGAGVGSGRSHSGAMEQGQAGR